MPLIFSSPTKTLERHLLKALHACPRIAQKISQLSCRFRPTPELPAGNEGVRSQRWPVKTLPLPTVTRQLCDSSGKSKTRALHRLFLPRQLLSNTRRSHFSNTCSRELGMLFSNQGRMPAGRTACHRTTGIVTSRVFWANWGETSKLKLFLWVNPQQSLSSVPNSGQQWENSW